MSESTPNPERQGLWHAPKAAQAWRESAPPSVQIVRVPALPTDLPPTPKNAGAWHLPARTTYSASDTLEIEQIVEAPSAKAVAATLSPEDLIAEILGQTGGLSAIKPAPAPALAPEDFLLSQTPISEEAPTQSAPALAPEDTAQEGAPTSALPEILPPDAGEGLAGLAELGQADDDEGEAEPFSLTEYQALLDLEAKAATGTEAQLQKDDLSPAAQIAALAAKAQDLLPANPINTGEKSSADIAREMAAKLTSEQNATGSFSDPNKTQLLPETAELVRQLRDSRDFVRKLHDDYQSGRISYDAAQAQASQPELAVYDASLGVWWQYGIDTLEWFKSDGGAWVKENPPYPLDGTTTLPVSTDYLGGSLPYFPPDSAEEYSSGMLGMEGSNKQPSFDPNLTVASDAANLNTLNMTLPSTGNATLENMPVVQDTIPVARMNYEATTPINTGMASEPLPTGYEPRPFDEALPSARPANRRAATFAALLIVGVVICGALAAFGAIAGANAWYTQQVEPWRASIAALANYTPQFQTARILDAEGRLIVELNSRTGGARQQVRLDQVSPFLIHAVISTQDPSFFEEQERGLTSNLSAAAQALTGGTPEVRNPTIAEQLARSLVLGNPSPNAQQTLLERLVAQEILATYDKNFILQLYLNESYFANQSYGAEAAAQFYFDKPAKDLNLAEAALLAGILQSPNANDPVVNRAQAVRALRDTVRQMLNVGCLQFQHGNRDNFCIDESVTIVQDGQNAPLIRVNSDGTFGGAFAIQLAISETASYTPRTARGKYQHFVNYVLAQLEQTYGADAIYQRGFTVYTTLIPRMQDAAEDALRSQVAALVNNGIDTGAVMVSDPANGAIRALVGSPDFNNAAINGQEDYARTWQSAGDIIKPVVYSASLEGGQVGYYTPASILFDVPSQYTQTIGGTFTPTNPGGRFAGAVSLRTALQSSWNVAAVKAFEFVGTDRFVNMANRLGLNFLPEDNISLLSALGYNQVRLIDMMKVYSTIASGGRNTGLYAIERITENVEGTEIDVVLPERQAPSQAISPQLAFLMQNMLSDDPARTGLFPPNSALTLANLGFPTQGVVGAYSGTSPNRDDLWTVGFTNNTVVGVWLGKSDGAPTVNATGFSAAAPLWNTVMRAALTGRNPSPFGNPGGIVQDTVCGDSGTLAGGVNCPNRRAEIYNQNQPPPSAEQGFVANVLVDSWTGLRANPACPENQVTQTFANITDTFALQWVSTTNEGRSWAQRVGLPTDARPMPMQECQQGQTFPTVLLNSPTDNLSVSGTLTITGQISAADFARFDIEFAPQNSANFIRIASSNQQYPSAGSTLTTWDTTAIPNGIYTLRLAAYSVRNGYIFRTVNVQVNNLPTPTPTLTQAPILPTQAPVLPSPFFPTSDPNLILPPTISAGFTPLPFDSLNPTPTLMP